MIVILYCILGVVFVDTVGYLWHRFVKHEGVFGKWLAHEHHVHHNDYYPSTNLRPDNEYRDADLFSWNLFAAVCVLGLFICLPLSVFIPVAGTGVLYAALVVSWFHKLYHYKTHWLHKYPVIQRLIADHDLHHREDKNYGIVFFWMDRLFGTYHAG